MITLDLYELKNLCIECAELGAANYAKRVSPAKDLISQRQAYKEFLESRVKRWVNDGLVRCERMGAASRSKILYSRAELLACDTAEKLKTYSNNK